MENVKKYDVAIIGGGTAGVFAAYEINRLLPDRSIVIVERGHSIYKRSCPIVAGKIDKCIQCNPCAIMNGFGGAGAFSDGKFNFTTEFGGWLNDYLDDSEVMDLIEYVDSVNVSFGATEERFSTYSEQAHRLMKRALENDMHLLMASVKHLGTEKNLQILKHIFDYMSGRVDILCDTAAVSIKRKDDGTYALGLEDAITLLRRPDVRERSGSRTGATSSGSSLSTTRSTSASESSCRRRFSRRSRTRSTRRSLSTERSSTATRSGLSA